MDDWERKQQADRAKVQAQQVKREMSRPIRPREEAAALAEGRLQAPYPWCTGDGMSVILPIWAVRSLINASKDQP